MKTERICQLIAIGIGARCAFAAKNDASAIGVDGLCYLEVARAYLRHDWHTALNAYWGPLYSWLLTLGMGMSHANVESELPLAQGINFIIFAISILSFGLCWKAIGKWSLRTSAPGTSLVEIYPAGWTILGYALYVTAAAWYVGVLVPDLLVAAIVFAAITVLFRLEDGTNHGIAAYAGWGALLALGYYAKVILFYFGLLLLIGLFLRHLKKRSFIRPAAALATFLILISPFALFLSRVVGHFTVGESGRLSYAWLANVPETKTWLRGEPDSTASLPYYPGPFLHDNPMVFQLPLLPGITYAARYDPSRYDFHNHPHFSLRPQLERIAINLRPFKLVLLEAEGPLLVALFILALYSPREFLRKLMESWFYSIPVLVIVAMYVLVFLTWRYLLAFSPLLWGTAFAAVSVPIGWRGTVRPIVLAGLIVFALLAGPGLMHFLVQKDNSNDREIALVRKFSQYGIEQGDTVAIFGTGQNAWWAHLAGVSIRAEVWPSEVPKFFASSPTDQREILKTMLGTGAKAVVWRRDSKEACPSPWQPLPQNSGCIYASGD
ncbi:MAG TPA: hypothetical protein VLK33_02310 [Terriglobales bacterium]|nr:hypothetical protein [Terriglobales bacterium]